MKFSQDAGICAEGGFEERTLSRSEDFVIFKVEMLPEKKKKKEPAGGSIWEHVRKDSEA